MKKLFIFLLILAIPCLVQGGDYAKKFPTDTPLEVLTPSTGVKLNQSTPQSTIGTFTFPNLVVNALEDISVDGMGNLITPPTNNIYKGLLLSNDTPVSSAVRETPPYIILRGHGWTGSADMITEHSILSDPMSNNNPTFKVAVRKGGSGSWTSILVIDSSGQFALPYKFTAYNNFETLTKGVEIAQSGVADVTNDQWSPYLFFRSAGWKTDATAGSQDMCAYFLNTPEQGTVVPTGVFKALYSTNSITPSSANELYRLEWGDRLGIDFNKLGLANYHFNVTALLAEFGSTPIITTGTFGAGAITGTSFTIGANTLTTSEFAFLDGQDQVVKTTSSPTFTDITINGTNLLRHIYYRS